MEFVKFKRAVHAQFNQLAAGADMLFLTNVDKDALWDCYLNSFPEEERQSHLLCVIPLLLKWTEHLVEL